MSPSDRCPLTKSSSRRSLGATAAYLNVYDFNREAIALYHSLGRQDHRRTLRLETD
jgi:hypothetical protein